MKISLWMPALLATSAQACLFTSKSKAMKHIVHFMDTHGHPVDNGMSRRDFEDVVDAMPGSLAWVVRKVGGVDKVMQKCDTNRDDVVYIPEALKAKHCLVDCWKQSAVMMFLN